MNVFISFSRRVVTASVFVGLASPLIVTPWLAFPFVSGKALFVEAVVLVALPFWITLLLLDPVARPRRHPLILALVAQAVVLVLASLFGVDPLQSFWGRDERMMGIITIFSLLALLGMALSVFRTRRAWNNVLLTALVIAWANIIWGLIEHFYPVFWADFRGESMRVVGLIGNPIFYGGYMMLSAILSIALIPEIKCRIGKVFLIITAAAATLVTLYSGTRGAGLGLFGGLAVGLLFAAFKSPIRKARVGLLVGIAGIIAALVFFFVFRDAPFLKPVRELRRLGSAFSLSDATAIQRMRLWRVSLEGALARPLFGWGPENFDYLFDQHFDPLFLKFTLRETFADRPHNAFIQTMTDVGVLGFLALIALQIIFIRSVFRLRDSNGSLWVRSAFVSFLAASDIYLFFAFDTLPTLLLTLLVSGWLIVSTSKMIISSGRIYSRQASFVVPAVGLLALSLIIFGVIHPASALAAIHRVTATDPRTQTERWFGHLKTAASIKQPYQEVARYRLGNAVFSAVGDGLVPDDRASEALELGIQALRQSVAGRPRDYGSRFTLGNLLLLSAARGRGERFAEAEAEFLWAAELSPRRQSTYIQLGNLKAVSGDPTASLSYYQQAVDLDPQIGEPHWYLGRGFIKSGEKERAVEEFVRSWDLGFRPKLKNEIREAASLLFGQGRLDFTILLYQRSVDVFPDDAELQAELAAAYVAAGNAEAARAAVRRAVELDPSFAAEAETFLNLLDSGALSAPAEGE